MHAIAGTGDDDLDDYLDRLGVNDNPTYDGFLMHVQRDVSYADVLRRNPNKSKPVATSVTTAAEALNDDQDQADDEPATATDALTEPGSEENEYDETAEARDQATADSLMAEDDQAELTGVQSDDEDDEEWIEVTNRRAAERNRRRSHLEVDLNRPQRKGPVTVSKGKRFEYLGIDLDYSKLGKVVLDTPKHIGSILDTATPDMRGTAETPAANHLFQTRDDAPAMSKEEADLCRTLIAKILFVACRTRPDLKLALSFLTTRVKNPDLDDYRKLVRLVRYIRATRNLKLTLTE